MGCDIHCFVEKRNKETKEWERFNENIFSGWRDEKGAEPFGWRNYEAFATLADVRNRLKIQPIASYRGIPEDVSEEIKQEMDVWRSDAHSENWLTLKELLDFDFDKCASEDYQKTYRELIGSDEFFINLEELKTVGNPDDVRIVFWFDN